MFRLLVVPFCFLLAATCNGLAQSPGELGYEDVSLLPKGKKGERIQALIKAYNANDPAAVARFIEQECAPAFRDIAPMEVHQNVFLQTYRETGLMQFHSVRKYDPPRPDETIMIYRDQQFDSWRAVTFRFDDTEEMLISGLRFNQARTPSNVSAQASLAADQLPKEAAALVDRLCEKDVFSGSVLVAKGDQVLYENACGEASKRFHVANNLDTKFNLGSMNKMFTATAIMQLVEAEKISLEDPISKYVDESWLPKAITDQVTIHHLLTHTSGLGSYFNDAYWDSSRELYRSVDDFKPLVKDEDLTFAPGERFQYSNTGMLLLGVVIEKVSGMDYFAYIDQHIYALAGMQHSGSFAMDHPVENLAMGYIPDPASPYGWSNNLYKHVIKGGPAGGGFSTARDLHRFATALQAGKLVSKASLETMWTSHSDQRYGYGFGVEENNLAVGKVVGHGGGFPGLNANLDMFLDKGYIVIVMSNYDRGAQPVARRIYEMVGQVEQ